MYEDTNELTMEEALFFLQESVDNNVFKEKIVEPIMSKLSSHQVISKYVGYGNDFLSANSDMLAKEYPTQKVSFPQRYVDSVIQLFGFDNKAQLDKYVREALTTVNAKTDFKSIRESPTNIIHTVVLHYSDLVQNRKLRDSARQQLALTMWERMYNKYWGSTPVLNEGLMAYTYSKLNMTWDIVNAENMINWITEITEGAYALYRTKLDLNLSMKIVVMFLNETRNRFNQKTRGLSNLYYEYKDKNVSIGNDTTSDDDYIDTNAYSNIRSSLMRLIKNKDKGYWGKGELYKGIGRWKNVDVDSLYDFAMKVHMDDISKIMDLIFYVFLVKEGNTIKDINSVKYINRITNLPTAIDRCIPGKPVIKPLMKKYDATEIIVRSYICLIATYIMQRINDVNEN
jgi:hypothetical protein